MFEIDTNKTIHLTRGDVAVIEFAPVSDSEEPYMLKADDIVRFKVFEKKQCDVVVLQKDIVVADECPAVEFQLDSVDTRIGGLISRPVDYWYEIEINPNTIPQTPICYDKDGPKIFRLYPEGGMTDEH